MNLRDYNKNKIHLNGVEYFEEIDHSGQPIYCGIYLNCIFNNKMLEIHVFSDGFSKFWIDVDGCSVFLGLIMLDKFSKEIIFKIYPSECDREFIEEATIYLRELYKKVIKKK